MKKITAILLVAIMFGTPVLSYANEDQNNEVDNQSSYQNSESNSNINVNVNINTNINTNTNSNSNDTNSDDSDEDSSSDADDSDNTTNTSSETSNSNSNSNYNYNQNNNYNNNQSYHEQNEDCDNDGGNTPAVNHAPDITLIGSNPLEITQGTNFVDPGATANDVEDGDLTSHIVVTGSVDANVVGTYTLTYTVTDSAGSSVSTNRTVKVVSAPLIPPTCENINSMTGWYANYYDYSALHPDMEESMDTWNSSYGDPLSVNSAWTADWYNSTYLKFSKVDQNLEFGEGFFPLDSIAGAEITNGHNFHFGTTWSAMVSTSTTGDYAYTLTSDDDAWVYVDGVLVVDNSLVHAPLTKTGTIHLTAGTHIIKIFFAERHTVRSHMNFKFTDTSLSIKPYNPSCVVVNTPPTINLVGNNPIEITVNTNFTDPGATANDAEDGNLTSAIVATGIVGTTTVGTYTITYSVTDSGGLSTSTTRTVNVVSGGNGGGSTNTPPTITLVGSNPFNVATDTAFIDPGATANDTEDGNITSNIIVTGGVNASTTGTYILTYSVTDSGGLSTSTTRTVFINATPVVVPPTSTPTNNGGSGGSGGIGGRRHDISNLITSNVLGDMTQCSYLRDYLRKDFNNDKIEVLKLQAFLNTFEKESVPLDGVFGDSTLEAVNRFQDKYKSDILTPWGHTAPTGYVYILTKKKINEIYCNTMYPLSTADQNEINAFRSYLESLQNGGSTIDLSNYVGLDDNGTVKDTSTVDSVIDKTQDGINSLASSTANLMKTDGLKNLAISLLGMPKGLGHVSSTYLLIILALVLIIAYALKSRGESKPESIVVLGGKKEENKDGEFKGLITENDSDKDDDTNGPSSNNSSGTGFKGILG